MPVTDVPRPTKLSDIARRFEEHLQRAYKRGGFGFERMTTAKAILAYVALHCGRDGETFDPLDMEHVETLISETAKEGSGSYSANDVNPIILFIRSCK